MKLFCVICSNQWLGNIVFEGDKTYQDFQSPCLFKGGQIYGGGSGG